MKGDFTRDTFNSHRHYTRVLAQQGRMQLDADLNEQSAISQHLLQTLAADLIGPHGGPLANCGFKIISDASTLNALTNDLGQPLPPDRLQEIKARLARGDFLIGQGRYYVHGRLAQCDTWTTYSEQLGYPFGEDTAVDNLLGVDNMLIYLDVWERHLAAAERPELLDAALDGLDTSTRSELVWQVKVSRGETPRKCAHYQSLARERLPLLRAAARTPEKLDGKGEIYSEARYRGAENRLYRIEIQRGGTARAAAQSEGGASFSWSRQNGSVLIRVLSHFFDGSATVLELADFGPDGRTALTVGDWVQIVDDGSSLRGSPTPMLQVARVDSDKRTVSLTGFADDTGRDPAMNPALRRWDHVVADHSTGDAGALLVREATDPDDAWIELEDGVSVQFLASTDGKPHDYRTGDYWLIPARTTIGAVLWPEETVDGSWLPMPRPPEGVSHHYAPLAIGSLSANGAWTFTRDCRHQFSPMSSPV
ncbi:hypothetical protein GA707_13830 [Nostocoides sp. F2B08]|uniref:DUF6519 domain-containing protein n=1 Tax=Nostocoides sp. F2B08 TaxID=2653936 RepID=UPI0012633AF1|nr:DUF6519 domain-containing protein [Tetrasphaera sp. F2B08]KAB7743197.1 hypothetical protein GA707_13830 [Tetrasphaera sp. F2B08]